MLIPAPHYIAPAGGFTMTAGSFIGTYFGYDTGTVQGNFGSATGDLSGPGGGTVTALFSSPTEDESSVLRISGETTSISTITVDGTPYSLFLDGSIYLFGDGTEFSNGVTYEITLSL